MALGSDQATVLLVQLYAAILGRPPDTEALARIVPQLVAGADPAVIRSQLATGSLEATFLIDGFYADLLGRGADLPSFTQYLAGLSTGAFTLAALRAQFAAGPEAASAIGLQYLNVLGRDADATGLAYFQSALGAGGTLSQIRQALATSPEEASSLAALYRQVLGRAPTAAESYDAGLGFENHGSLASLQTTLAGSAEALTRLSTQYELNFGAAPAPGTLALQVTELKLGRPFSDVVQVTANFVTRQDVFFIYNDGYAIPAQYSSTGSQQSVSIYQNTSPLQIGAAFTTVPIPTTGAAAPGPDTITVNLRTVGAAPVSFTATVDGRAVGGATVTAGPPGSPFAAAAQNQVTFTGDFGAGLHDLRIQVTGDPAANALVIPGTATFDGNQFLLGAVTTGATGTADIFPHAGPQPAVIDGQTS